MKGVAQKQENIKAKKILRALNVSILISLFLLKKAHLKTTR